IEGEIDGIVGGLQSLAGEADDEMGQGSDSQLPAEVEDLLDPFRADSLFDRLENSGVAAFHSELDGVATGPGHFFKNIVGHDIDTGQGGPMKVVRTFNQEVEEFVVMGLVDSKNHILEPDVLDPDAFEIG